MCGISPYGAAGILQGPVTWMSSWKSSEGFPSQKYTSSTAWTQIRLWETEGHPGV